jgi:hypothetical protein
LSYCVNCGVELDKSAKKCALCQTPVYVPAPDPLEAPADKPFSDDLHIPAHIRRRFIAYVITMVLLIPNIVLFFVNIFFFQQSPWSVYVGVTSFLVWTLFVFPFFFQKAHPYVFWAVDTVAVSLYSYFFFVLKSEHQWTFSTIFSVIFVVSLASLIFIWWFRKKKHHWTSVTALILGDLTVVSLVSGAVASVLSDRFGFFAVGLICAACFLALMIFFLYCSRNKHMRAWLNKTFYI